METLEQKLAQQTADFERKQEATRAQYAVIHAIQSRVDIGSYEPPMSHFHKLYGCEGSIHFRACKYSSIAKGKNPDRALLAALLTAFPPTPKVRVKDGCTSFRPSQGEWKGELYDCGGVTVKIDNIDNSGPDCTFEWNADIDGKLWRIEVEFSLHNVDLGTLRLHAERYPDGRVKHWDVCSFTPKAELGAQAIRWAAGSREYPNSFTVYWDRDSGNAMNYPALVKESTNFSPC